ncbi:tripartite tricarboxylate transporter substrate-binding protein [Variovorax sp. UC122_21]|uniref:tripartite tricarboxylate transporter substrate-binding protein n=1 Tax=Variovorax sp. UC122_21 TaxID=3374554 RepID=UPI003757C088
MPHGYVRIRTKPTSATPHRAARRISWDFRSPGSSGHRCRTSLFPGAAPMIVNLTGANVAAGTSTVGDFAQHHNAGKLRVLAVTSAERSPLLPNVPTFGELGRKELTAVGVLAICLAPGTPTGVVSEWSAAVRTAAATEQFSSRVRKLGFMNTESSPDEARARFAEMRGFWEPIVKASGFKAD